MSEAIQFVKISGSGNDFLCIDNRDGRYDPLLADPARVGRLARVICRRGISVGADGVIFACANEVEGFADLSARHFEPDGSEAELCGNGVACFTRWALDNRWVADSEVKILTTAGVVRGKRIDKDYIRVCIPLPESMQQGLEVDTKGRRWDCDFAITGVPHLATYVDDLEDLDIAHWGPLLRYHPRFAPRGVNANFVKVLGVGKLAVRSWEFGVEGETLACGTGSATAAIMAARRFNWPREFLSGDKSVEVLARGGDTLRVYFTLQSGGEVSDLCLETFVRFVFTGTLHEDLVAEAMPAEAAARGQA
ncbi:MAG: diaminopimelate epimerase [Phycisphaerae bacterium]